MDDHPEERRQDVTERAWAVFPEQRLKELTGRAWTLGYRLINRNHDYLLWGVHQRRPILATHTAAALDGDRGIAELLAGIARLPVLLPSIARQSGSRGDCQHQREKDYQGYRNRRFLRVAAGRT